jgi:hypothetical protein
VPVDDRALYATILGMERPWEVERVEVRDRDQVVALTKLLTAMLYGVSPRDPVTFGAVTIVLAVVALKRSRCFLEPFLAR